MRTATITWTTYNNYGTILQAYALQQELFKLGHENVILGDKEIIAQQMKSIKEYGKENKIDQISHVQSKTRVWRLLTSISILRKAKRILLSKLNHEQYGMPYYASQDAFEKFKEQKLVIREVAIESLDALNCQYDAFIAGSDQVWSLNKRTFNPFYYLNFVSGKKIAYAPCLGTDQIPDDKKQMLVGLLKDYHAISVREEVSAKQLSELVGRTIEWVADPTLLLCKEDWGELVKGKSVPVKGRYLLCYFLENQPWYFEQVKLYARKNRLKPVLIPNKWDYLSNELVVDGEIGPSEFVALFMNADCVITDSYHGSIFSMIFEKRFVYLQRFKENDPNSQNMRIESLFGFLSCTERVLREYDPELDIPAFDPIISYRIELLRQKSLNFLIESLK